MSGQKIVAILPVFNEEAGIIKQIEVLISKLAQIRYNFKIIIVNDGSTDRTGEILRRYIKKNNLILINHSKNLGVGRAFYSGFLKALQFVKDEDIVITLEADRTSDLSLLKTMIDCINDKYQLVAASRLIKGGAYKGVPIHRKYLSIFLNYFMSLLYPIDGVFDYSGFYRAYKAEVIRKLFARYGKDFIRSKGFTVSCELILKIRKITNKIVQIPFIYRYDLKKSTSKLNILRTIFDYLFLFIFGFNL